MTLIPCKLSVVARAIREKFQPGPLDLRTWVWQVSLLTLLYFIAGRLGLEFTYHQDTVTLVLWPPVGLSLAALIIFGRRLWPGVLIGSLLVNLVLQIGWTAKLGIAVGSTLEAVIGVTLLMRAADFRPNLERLQDGTSFFVIGVLGCTMISATIGVTSTILSGDTDPSRLGIVWLIWWMGDMGGVLVLTPVLLMLVYGTPSWGSLARRFETWFVLALVLTTSLGAFFGPNFGLMSFAVAVTPFPMLVWAGTRLGPRGATIASFLIVLIAMIATGVGSGPYVTGSTTEAMLMLWPYSMFSGLTAFTLAAVVEQRNRSDRKYRLEAAERLTTEKEKLLLLERERMTREMDDGLGGQLASILVMVEQDLAAPGQVAEALRRAVDDIRILIDSLDPTTTDLPTSLGKLRARLEPLLRRNGIALTWSVDENFPRNFFAPEAVLHLLRIIQGAMTNMLRHANTNRVDLRLTFVDGESSHALLSIHDDRGGQQTSSGSDDREYGNLMARAERLGAEIRVKETESGTQVDLTIPPSP